jgi:hypothetical protein
MNLGRGRARRPDDWPSSHVRARADLSERLDLPLEPAEASWLESHLQACPDCRVIADSYAAQRLELRALQDRMPPPPRDLWARTAAAIETEARFRDGRARSAGWRTRRSLAPSALLAAALVAVVAVGTLTSSQRPGGVDAPPSAAIAVGTTAASAVAGGSQPGATPILAARRVDYLARDDAGRYTRNVMSVDEVCPPEATEPCASDGTVEEHPIALDQDASTVFGSPDEERLIVVNDPTSANSGGTVSVLSLAGPSPDVTPTPSVTTTATPATASATPTGSASVPPSASPKPPTSPSVPPSTVPTPPSSSSPSPSVAVTPTPSGSIEIAHDVVLVGQSASYSASGRWFAFTARPVDGSVGPDIYAWKVGDALASRLTTDHRSVFGSWAGDVMVGSTVVPTTKGNKTELEPASFLLDPATATVTDLPQTGKAWRPAVDPDGRLAVYWTGTVQNIPGVPGFAPEAGRLVLGDWGTGTAAPSDGAAPTALTGDQIALRHETTIEAGRMNDWDARWDSTGTHLAVWIMDDQNPAVGRLSLYKVDSFDGKIDLKKPLLDGKLATAGYSMSDGKLVWAEPSDDGSVAGGKLQLLAWTEAGVGTVETVTGPVIVIR